MVAVASSSSARNRGVPGRSKSAASVLGTEHEAVGDRDVGGQLGVLGITSSADAPECSMITRSRRGSAGS